MYLVLLLNALLASTFVLGKIVLAYTTPLFFVGTSMVMGGLILLGYLFFKERSSLRVAGKDTGYFFRVSFFTIALSYGLQFWGMQYMPAFKTCFLYNISPFASYLIAFLMFNQKMRLKKWIGLIIGFAGLIPILISTSPAEQGLGSMFFFSGAEVAVLASAVFYAYGWFDIRVLVHERNYSPLLVNGVSMLLGGSGTLLAAFLIEGRFVIHNMSIFLALLIATIMIEYLICNNLYAMLLNRHSETFLSFSTFLIPLFGAIYSCLFLQEVITWHFFLSTFIVGVAIWFFYKAELEEHHTMQDLMKD